MKHALLMTAAVAMLATVFVQDANATEPQPADVPSAVLGDLGLGGMQTISDAEGMDVRGMNVEITIFDLKVDQRGNVLATLTIDLPAGDFTAASLQVPKGRTVNLPAAAGKGIFTAINHPDEVVIIGP